MHKQWCVNLFDHSISLSDAIIKVKWWTFVCCYEWYWYGKMIGIVYGLI